MARRARSPQRSRRFRDLGIGIKFGAVVALAALALTFVSWRAVSSLASLDGSANELSAAADERGELLSLDADALRMRVTTLRHGLALDTTRMPPLEAQITALDASIATRITTIAGFLHDDEQAVLATFQEALASYQQVRDEQFLPASRIIDQDTVMHIAEDVYPAFVEAMTTSMAALAGRNCSSRTCW